MGEAIGLAAALRAPAPASSPQRAVSPPARRLYPQNVNGTWPGEGVYTALAVALSGYANNKGASFQDLLANWQSTQASGKKGPSESLTAP